MTRSFPHALCRSVAVLAVFPAFWAPLFAQEGKRDSQVVAEEHSGIGLTNEKSPAGSHTTHPDAQWYPDAGFGLFLHWSISSVKAMNISWPMIPGRALGKTRISDPNERARILRDEDYDLNGKKPSVTPNQYWAMAKDFNPLKYDPEKWCQAAKEAGFTYIVLTTRHHDGFALWPSAFGDFSTKNYMGGRDLVKPFVDACRKYGIRVGLYYSPPDWYFERDHKNFLYYGAKAKNPELPDLDADLKQTHLKPMDAKERKAYESAYDRLVAGQVRELLTRYGKIDLLWFDGRQSTPNAAKSITLDEIRKLQPGIVINPRLHGKGDFITYERELKTRKIATSWAEFCNTWTLLWTYDTRPFRSDAFALGQLAQSRSLGINYLLGTGPDAQGELHPDAYKHMQVIAEWMKKHSSAVHAAKPLPKGETSNVPATALNNNRYLFALRRFRDNGGKPGMYDADMLPPESVVLTLKGLKSRPASVVLMGDGSKLDFDFAGDTLTVKLPAEKRTNLVDVVEVQM